MKFYYIMVIGNNMGTKVSTQYNLINTEESESKYNMEALRNFVEYFAKKENEVNKITGIIK